LRRKIFVEKCPGIPLPPKPIITRWGTWIDAAIYYANNFESVKTVINSFESEASQSIKAAQGVMGLPKLKRELALIKQKYECLSVALTAIQKQGLPLSEGLEIFFNIGIGLEKTHSQNASVCQKFQEITQKNKGLHILSDISKSLNDSKAEVCEFVQSLSPKELSAYAFAPITSCDVERSFSSYNVVLSDNRQSFTFESLKQHVIIKCNDF